MFTQYFLNSRSHFQLSLLLIGINLFLGYAYAQGKISNKGPATLVPESLSTSQISQTSSFLVEAESFQNRGGWVLDTQFITQMGSPYLLAHGLGRPVADASTEVTLSEVGSFHVFVRTQDWVAKFENRSERLTNGDTVSQPDPQSLPGRFSLWINDVALPNTLGNKGKDWNWQYAGKAQMANGKNTIRLKDLTGFDGRCDAIYFTKNKNDLPPENDKLILSDWRRAKLGIPENSEIKDTYDLVVIGGGYSGMGAAISAARAGCKVALIQDRNVLGGNGSSEVRVWAMGLIRRGNYPRIGEIIDEFADSATKSPGTLEEFGDDIKLAIIQNEPNIDLFLNEHAFAVQTLDNRILSVTTLNTLNSRTKVFTGRLFSDCTGHGTIGYLSGADWDMTDKGRMGMSNMWAWGNLDSPQAFPETPWAVPLTMKDFPYPRDFHGQWFWESGFDKDPIKDAESIRDWNLRAVYGAFNAMKNGDGAKNHLNAQLQWLAYIGGTRESRRLMGDVLLTEQDIVSKREFPDGCVPSTWSIDLHYPKQQYAAKFPDNPFISIAEHDKRVDRNFGYPVPYRCFYSKNIDNLFMAGRCISVTHEALGTVRVMKTCGMMGEVVGKAASVCIKHNCTPRKVYESYWQEMEGLLILPGAARRPDVNASFAIPDNVPELPMVLKSTKMPGTVVDDQAGETFGIWEKSTGVPNFIDDGYLYTSSDSGRKVSFPFLTKQNGRLQINLSYQPHENRGTTVPVRILIDGKIVDSTTIDMQKIPPKDNLWFSLEPIDIHEGQSVVVEISTEDAGGIVCADAVQFIMVDE